MTTLRLWLLLLACLAFACGDDTAGAGGAGGSAQGGGGMTGGGGEGQGGMAPFALTSTAYAEGETIPQQYECGPPLAAGPGSNISPPLSWTPGPTETLSYAIVMRDRDAGNLVHWVVYDIPASSLAMPEGVPMDYLLSDPAGAKQAKLQDAVHAYLGPCSPNNVNTYEITVHALAVATLPGVGQETAETSVASLIEDTSIARASLSGES